MLSQGEGCREDVGGEQMATNTSMVREITNFEMYTTWAHILSDSNVFCTPKGRGKTAGSNAPGAFIVTPPSGRGLVIPVFFFRWSLAPGLRSVKTILARNLRSFSVISPEFSWEYTPGKFTWHYVAPIRLRLLS